MGWDTISDSEYCWIVFSAISAGLYGIIIYIIISCRHSQPNSFYHAPFFTIILIQAFHGLLLSATINLVMRPRKFLIIQYPITDDSKLVEFTYYWYSIIKNNLYLSYILIAANRMTVFFVHANYKKIWSPKMIYISTAGFYIFLVLLRLLSMREGHSFETKRDPTGTLFMFTVPPFMDVFDSMLDIILSIGSGVSCCFLYGIAAFVARNTIITGNRKKREIIIFRSAFVAFLLMLPSAVRGAVQCYAILAHDNDLKIWSNKSATYFVEVMYVAEPWVLLLTFHTIRQRVYNFLGTSVVPSQIEQSSGPRQAFTISR